MLSSVDWDRILEIGMVFASALSATAARVIHNLLQDAANWPVAEPELTLWRRRLSWAIAGEVAAVITFVMVAEAIVIYRNWSSPVAVLMGAGAAVLGYPFLAGLFRRKVEQRMNAGSTP